jgi:hypothetical protein
MNSLGTIVPAPLLVSNPQLHVNRCTGSVTPSQDGVPCLLLYQPLFLGLPGHLKAKPSYRTPRQKLLLKLDEKNGGMRTGWKG